MRFAIDKNKKRTFIDSIIPYEDYFCPICNDKLIIKMGSIIAHHFAHHPSRKCTDTYHHDEKTAWHISWQNQFKHEEQEVILIKDNVKHIADVLLKKEKIVIEFQHSSLSSNEFDDRNNFYTSSGYKVIWIFDMRNEFNNSECIYNLPDSVSKFRYLNPKKTFKNFTCKNSDVTLFFQAKGDDHCNNVLLYKIIWQTEKGLDRFVGDNYTINDFFLFLKGKPKPLRIIKNSILYLWKKSYKVMIVKNVKDDEEYMIIKNPIEQYKKYKKIYGRYKDSFGEFVKDSIEIENFNEGIWKLIWHK